MGLALPFFLVWMQRDAATRSDPGFIPRDRRAMVFAMLAGLALAADLIAWHWCLHMTTVATATLLGNTTPIWVALAGFLFLRERFRPLFLIGLALAMLGIWGLVAGGTKPVEIKDVFVLVLGLFTGLAYAAYFRFGTAARQRGLSTAQVMFWGSVSATIVLLPVALITEDAVLPQSPARRLLLADLAHEPDVRRGLRLADPRRGADAAADAGGHRRRGRHPAGAARPQRDPSPPNGRHGDLIACDAGAGELRRLHRALESHSGRRTGLHAQQLPIAGAVQ
jgi:uncharacterized membrane protein